MNARIGAIVEVGREMGREWQEDRVSGLAAEVAFYAILSLFPALLMVTATLGLLEGVVGSEAAGRIQDSVIDSLSSVLTDEADGTLSDARALFDERSTGLLTFGALGALWAMSRGFAALVRALDIVYDLDEVRTWIKQRTVGLGLAAGTVLMGTVTLALLVVGPLLGSGDELADGLGLGRAFTLAWDVLRPPIAFLALVGWAATIFHIGPDHKTPWRWDLPGAVLTAAGWVTISLGLRFYIGVSTSGANSVFGALGGALIVLMWFWLLAVVLLVGGELNAILTQRWQDAGENDAAPPGSGSVQGRADLGQEGGDGRQTVAAE